YLKLDYNIMVGPGTDTGGISPGAGLLAANRAQLDWLDAVLDRHPGLVIENCSSGGMRIVFRLSPPAPPQPQGQHGAPPLSPPRGGARPRRDDARAGRELGLSAA